MAPPPAAAPDKRLAAVNLGINFAAAMAVLGYLGYRYDQWRGEGGQGGTLAGLFMGLIYGAYEVWKVVRTPPPDPSPSPPPDSTPPPS